MQSDRLMKAAGNISNRILRAVFFAVAAAAVAVAVWRGGIRGAEAYERLAAERVRTALDAAGADWARLEPDGLKFEIHGRAPNIDAHAVAIGAARDAALASRIVDRSTVSLASSSEAKPVLVELHRESGEITVTGRFHGHAMKRGFADLLKRRLPKLEIHDLSGETAARPGSEWGPEMELAATAVAALDDATVRAEPGRVRVEGTAPGRAARSALSDALLAVAGRDVALDLAIRLPPRVVVPFEFSVAKGFDGLRVESCAVRTSGERERTQKALIRRGAPDDANICQEGLGGPRADWAAAVTVALEALDLLPAGRFRLSYLDLHLEAARPAAPEDMDAALSHLDAYLPAPFRVVRSQSPNADAASAAPRDGYWFEAEAKSGRLRLKGRMPGAEERDALVLFARTLFPRTYPESALTISDHAPPRDWSRSLQVALGALSRLEEGSVRALAGRLELRGSAARPETAGTLYRDLRAALPERRIDASITLDLPALVAAIPLSEEACIVAMNRLAAARPVVFERGKTAVEKTSRPVLDRLAALYRRCEPARLRVVGFTDDRGGEKLNLRLSRTRAEAVMDALIARGVPYANIEALGMGEASPIADNDTPEGRAMNRRVEFHPVDG